MSGILTDLSEPALVRACKNNLYRFFETLRAWDEAEIFDDSQLQCWWTPLPHPWFNGVLSRNTLPGDATELIAETKAYFKDKDRQVITWWLAPELEESDWGKQLELNGLGFTNDPPGMAADLSKLNEDLRVPDGLEITKVEDAWEMKTWSEVFTTGYGLPPDWEPINRDMALFMLYCQRKRSASGYVGGVLRRRCSRYLLRCHAAGMARQGSWGGGQPGAAAGGAPGGVQGWRFAVVSDGVQSLPAAGVSRSVPHGALCIYSI
jgi:hypothetical protein